MSRVQQITVTPAESDLWLDKWFKSHFPGITHGQLEKFLRKGEVKVDKKRAKTKDRLTPGQVVRVPPMDDDVTISIMDDPKGDKGPPRVTDHDIADIRSMILHMDDDVIVLNKPAGIPVQGGTKQTRHIDGLLDGLRFDYDERPKLTHRLDKDTSGVLVIGRTRLAAKHLTDAFKRRATRKIYWALVVGVPRPHQATISYNLTKVVTSAGEKVIVDRAGQSAISDYSVVAVAGTKAAWLALKPLTGRTHQLRVHCAAIQTPIVGDGKYGGSDAVLEGIVSRNMHLHAREITISHPNGSLLSVTAPLGQHMAATWKLMGFHENDYEDPFEETDF